MKRSRVKKTKRWTILEERVLVDYLLENREFEIPTAQLFYNRLIKEKNIEAGWIVLRSKVRNMRVNFAKAKAWRDTPFAASMTEENVRKNLHKMCNYYDDFVEIFGVNDCVGLKKPIKFPTRLSESTANRDNPQTENINENAILKQNLNSSTDSDPLKPTKFEIDEFTTGSDCSTMESASGTFNGFNGIYAGKAASEINQIQTEMEHMKQNMSQDLALRERELQIREKELEIKAKEIALKEKELLSQEKLKILELEMKERLAMHELKHKHYQKYVFIKKKP